MSLNFLKRRSALVVIGLVIITGASVAPFMSASCATQQNAAGEIRALDMLRAMTRGDVLPAEAAVARIESEYPNTKAAGLARMVRARIKIKANDPAGAAALLDSDAVRTRTALGDYALLMRAQALEQAGRRVEARAAYEQLARNYPSSMRAREATLRAAAIVLQDGQFAAVPVFLKALRDKDDSGALLLTAKAHEQENDPARALAAYRRVYFYAPASPESALAAQAIARLNSTPSPASAAEALTRADKLYEAKQYDAAATAYAEAFARFPGTIRAETQLRRGIAAASAKRTMDAVAAFNGVPTSAGEVRAEALYNLAQVNAKARQWDAARTTLEEMRRAHSQSFWTPRAFVGAGRIAGEAKNDADASYFFRTAVNSYPTSIEVAQAQFELAWLAHEAKNFAESSRLLTEHLALYADRNTDNRGRAGYWAARDSERAGKIAEARALYEAMQVRYDANWYGYLAKKRLDVMARSSGSSGNAGAARSDFAADSMVGRAVANLQTVTVAEETAGQNEAELITRADQLSNIGADDWALEELAPASEAHPMSPRINLALARVYRAGDDNVRALNTLRKSYPDYSQMKPEELTRDEWDVFYPLAYWDIISQEARAKRLDPHEVAGLIRQESVFNTRARSGANAYGLMQLLLGTGRLVSKRYGVDRAVTAESLYEPRLNIQLGTGYMRDQIDKYGRIEYVAAAYNAGPGRVVRWRETLPLEIDEWAEAIPFKETRGYVQGVVRNTLQYRRLYTNEGKFRPEVGSRALRPAPSAQPPDRSGARPVDPTVRPRRITGGEGEE